MLFCLVWFVLATSLAVLVLDPVTLLWIESTDIAFVNLAIKEFVHCCLQLELLGLLLIALLT
jgi:hypothetical protein